MTATIAGRGTADKKVKATKPQGRAIDNLEDAREIAQLQQSFFGATAMDVFHWAKEIYGKEAPCYWTVWNFLTGRTRFPRFWTVIAILAALDCEIRISADQKRVEFKS